MTHFFAFFRDYNAAEQYVESAVKYRLCNRESRRMILWVEFEKYYKNAKYNKRHYDRV